MEKYNKVVEYVGKNPKVAVNGFIAFVVMLIVGKIFF